MENMDRYFVVNLANPDLRFLHSLNNIKIPKMTFTAPTIGTSIQRDSGSMIGACVDMV